MRFPPTLALCICFLSLPFQARALTDEEHARFSRDFPVYAQAEQRMNAAWRQLRVLVSKDEFQVLLGEQRAWLSAIRDSEAKALAGPGPFADERPLAEAYAKATVKRAEVLEARSKALAHRSAAASTPGVASGGSATAESGGTEPGGRGTAEAPVGTRAGESSGKRESVAGSYGSGANLVEVLTTNEGYYVAVSTSAPDARWVCEMQGLGVLDGDILRITSVSSGGCVVIPIQVRPDALVIPPMLGAACGSGGSIEGVYKRK